MTLKTALFLTCAALMLAACEPPRQPPPLPGIPGVPGESGACGADDLQYLVGKPARVLSTMKFAQTTRILRPGDIVTMDYSEQRLNIDIDLNEVISGVRCG